MAAKSGFCQSSLLRSMSESIIPSSVVSDADNVHTLATLLSTVTKIYSHVINCLIVFHYNLLIS